MKLNQFFSWAALVFLFAFPFLIGCGEEGRKMHFPDLDLPDSVTVTVEVPAGAAFDLAVSSDYREERDDLGNKFIVHNTEQKFSFTEDFSQTFPLVDSAAFPLVDPDERYFSVKLKCTALESESDEDTDSLHLIIKFNGEGNFDDGNREITYSTQPISPESIEDSLENTKNPDDIPGFFEVGTLIYVRTIFSRWNGISKRSTSGNADE
ncbi:MAG: hypothetical protein OXI43_09155 [Candidatus Poribacteria bacterium]|nr:hypothetical protein [Candidatus Poribacteria bacterium]